MTTQSDPWNEPRPPREPIDEGPSDEDVDRYGGDSADEETRPCPGCGHEVWESAENCPQCGEALDPESQPLAAGWFVLAIALLLALAAMWFTI